MPITSKIIRELRRIWRQLTATQPPPPLPEPRAIATQDPELHLRLDDVVRELIRLQMQVECLQQLIVETSMPEQQSPVTLPLAAKSHAADNAIGANDVRHLPRRGAG